MKLKYLLIISLSILYSMVAFGQNGPGGIGDTQGNSSLQLWLKATDLQESHSDGDRILLWPDRSGASNHVMGAISSAPFFKDGTGGNPSSVEFKGREFFQTEKANSSFSNPASTIFLVKKGAYKGASIAIANRGWVEEMLLFDYSQFHHSSSGNFTRSNHPCIEQIPDEELSIVCGVFGPNTSDLKYFVNGSEAPSGLQTAGRPKAFNNIDRKVTIGQRDQFVASEYFEGELLEIIVYNRQLSEEEIQQVEHYLQCTYPIEPSVCTELSEPACKTPISSCPLLADLVDTNPLELWLKAADLEEIFMDGGKVTIWPDRSGSLNHLLSSFQSAPAFQKGNAAIPSVVTFSGNQFLQTNSASSSFNNPESTIFLVKQGRYKGTAVAIAKEGWLDEMLLFDYAQFHHSSSGNFTKLDHPCIEQIPDDELSVICGVFGPNTNDLRYFVNGAEAPSAAMQTAGRPRPFNKVDRKVTIGQRDQFVASEYFEGGLLEVLVFNRQLNDEEIEQVENYLECTYQLAPSICSELNTSQEEMEPSSSEPPVIEPDCDKHLGYVVFESCEDGQLRPLIRTNTGVLVDPFFDSNLTYEPKDRQLVEFDFDSTHLQVRCSLADIAIHITCIQGAGFLEEVIEEEVSPMENDSLENDCNCPQVVEPVCATDGKVYNNRCEAECAGVGIVFNGPSCNHNDLCVVIIKNGYCTDLEVYDENGTLLTIMKPGPDDGFDGFTYWEDLNFLLRGTSRTYIFKEVGVEIGRRTASCEEYIIELVSDQADPCLEIIDSSLNQSNELFEEFTWLSNMVNPQSCLKASVAIYQSGIYKYLLVTDENGAATVYNDQGQFYCQNSTGYDCVAAYRLGSPIETWDCNGVTQSPITDCENCEEEEEEEEDSDDDDDEEITNESGMDAVLFSEYAWLSNLINPTDCTTESIAIYQSGIYKYLLVTDENGTTKMYNETGQFYCQNSANYDCVTSYNLEGPIDTWSCQSEADVLNDLTISEAQCQGVGTFTISINTKRPISSQAGVPPYRIYSEAGSPYEFDRSLSQFGEATLTFGDSLAKEIVILIEDTNNPSNRISIVRQIPECQSAIYDIYPFLKGEVDRYGCSGIEVFGQGNYDFVFLRLGPNKGRMYLDNGTFYCESTPAYDCLAAYGLGVPKNVYGCSNLDTPESEERNKHTQYDHLAFRVSPNPIHGQVRIQSPPAKNGYQLFIHDMLGRRVHQEVVLPFTTSTTLDMTDYENGVYYIELKATGMRGIQKVVKQ